eukprot:scaffold2243_cov165-Amphora_coffeaeformis.AAC.12
MTRIKVVYFSVALLLLLLAPALAWTPESRDNNRLSPASSQCSRRQVNQQLLWGGLTSGILLSPGIAQAGEVGARINAAVTKSDLGISVRRSVVKGAQIMDGIDGQWEQFSDRFGLGSNRARQAEKPLPKVIPPPQPLDGPLAAQLLDLSDQTFVALTKIPFVELDKQIDSVTFTVAPSYQRSGLNVSAIDAKTPRNGDEFNFLAYTHFKAYTDLILERSIDFRKFQKDYEEQMGSIVRKLILPNEDSSWSQFFAGKVSDPQVRRARWTATEERLRRFTDALVQRGLVAQVDTSYDKDDLTDWLDDAMLDFQFNIALDGDVTLKSQCLIQELGFRLYPNFSRYGIRNILQESIGTAVEITDYYMDTDYNSDPNRFEVKEVLLSVVLQSD